MGEPENGGLAVAQIHQAFEIPALGQMSYELSLPAPAREGKYLLTAKAFWDGKPWIRTIARRKATVK